MLSDVGEGSFHGTYPLGHIFIGCVFFLSKIKLKPFSDFVEGNFMATGIVGINDLLGDSAPVKPVQGSKLTPEQQRIRELEDQVARLAATKLTDAEPEFDDTKAEIASDILLIHVLEDGLTANGALWYKGQEVEFVIGSDAYNDTKDRNGISWLHMTDREQYQRWGKKYFGRGEWPGLPWEGPAADAEAKRARRAPVLPIR